MSRSFGQLESVHRCGRRLVLRTLRSQHGAPKHCGTTQFDTNRRIGEVGAIYHANASRYISSSLHYEHSFLNDSCYALKLYSTEIDHNFSRAHRIVTASILPIVDQYAEHSKNVWEGSKVLSIPCFSSSSANAFKIVLETVFRSECQCLSFRVRGASRRG